MERKLTPSSFVIHFNTRMHYAGLFLLKEILEKNTIFSFHLEDDEYVLEPILKSLEEVSYIRLNRHKEYEITKRGIKHIHSFLTRYDFFKDEYDVFSGVDLKTKDFAIRYYDTFEEEAEWFKFLQEERWEDLRIAIAELHGYDAIEMTFMRFVYEDRFGFHNGRWNYEYLLGGIWEEIQAVCNNAVRLHSFSKSSLLEDVLKKGQRLMFELGVPR